MSLRRTPTPEDAKALRYAGVLGHRYVVVADTSNGRDTVCHCNEVTRSAVHDLNGKLYPNLAVYEMVKTQHGHRWRRVR